MKRTQNVSLETHQSMLAIVAGEFCFVPSREENQTFKMTLRLTKRPHRTKKAEKLDNSNSEKLTSNSKLLSSESRAKKYTAVDTEIAEKNIAHITNKRTIFTVRSSFLAIADLPGPPPPPAANAFSAFSLLVAAVPVILLCRLLLSSLLSFNNFLAEIVH